MREAIINIEKTKALQKFNLSEDLPVVGLLGGSQGALVLNIAMGKALEHLKDVQIIWQVGPSHQDNYGVYSSDRIKVLPFVDDMGAFYAATDLVVSRAGALALAEIAACGKPSLLIPYAGAAGDHQSKNAESLRAAGAATILKQRVLNGERLATEIKSLINNTVALDRMASAAKAVSKPDAAIQIVEEIERIAII